MKQRTAKQAAKIAGKQSQPNYDNLGLLPAQRDNANHYRDDYPSTDI